MDFSQFILTVLDKYGVATVAIIIALIVLFRTAPGFINALTEMLRTRATSAATAQAGEVANDTKVLEILQKQVDNNTESNKTHAETNKILLQYQVEFAKSREQQILNRQTDEELKDAIKEFNTQTQALRLDLKSWPDTVDGTLAGAITAIETLRLSYESGERKANGDYAGVLDTLEDMQFKLNVIYRWVLRDPNGTEPDSTNSLAFPSPTNADAGAKVPGTQEAA